MLGAESSSCSVDWPRVTMAASNHLVRSSPSTAAPAGCDGLMFCPPGLVAARIGSWPPSGPNKVTSDSWMPSGVRDGRYRSPVKTKRKAVAIGDGRCCATPNPKRPIGRQRSVQSSFEGRAGRNSRYAQTTERERERERERSSVTYCSQQRRPGRVPRLTGAFHHRRTPCLCVYQSLYLSGCEGPRHCVASRLNNLI